MTQRSVSVALSPIFLLLVLTICRPAAAAPFDLKDLSWEGCRSFVDTLNSSLGTDRVIASNRIPWSDLAPADGLIIIHPTKNLDPEELSAFLKVGGRVAVLDDFGSGDEILARFHIERIPAPRLPLRSLRNNPALAIAEPVTDSAAGKSLGVHPIVANVSQVVTNHPTAFSHPSLTAVLQIRARNDADATIAVAGQVNRGRLIAVSDASIVINQMLRYPGNREFAVGLARYMVEDDTWGARGGKVYVVANRFEEVGVFGNESSYAKAVGASLRDAAAAIQGLHDDGLPSHFSIVFAALASLATLSWIAASAARAYKRNPPRFTRPIPLVAQGGVAGRAAVLSAPTTPRTLALLEVKKALEESLAVHLGLPLPVSSVVLLEAAQASRLFEPELLHALKRLLFTMESVETSMVAGTAANVRIKDLQQAAQIANQVHRCLQSNQRIVPQEP